jgi:selenocysteine-specific elongation factor
MIIATAGHVDHGKTSLVKALTGIDADRLPEEKRRGMTIDLGFAYAPGDAAQAMGFVDVPGHERFVHNMLAGVTGIDCALLVIAADDGPMPQTLEHLAILDLLGVKVGVVALTKIDAVEPGRVDAVAHEVAALLAPTSLAASPIFPISSITGAGLPALRTHLQGLQSERPRGAAGRFRMTVDRAFTVAGAGLVVTGTVLAGTIASGDEVVALLAGATARVRGLHAQNRASQRAGPGERCALNLAGSGVTHAGIGRGDWICTAGAAPATTRIDMQLRVLASENRPFRHWTPVHAHIGAADVTGRVALLETDALAPGKAGLAQLVLDRPMGACHGDAVILRDQSARRTVGGGRVIDVFAPPRGRARPARLAYLRAMAHDNHASALDAALAASPNGLDLPRFAACRNLAPTEFDALASASTLLRPVADTGFLRAHWQAARQAALDAVKAWHVRWPNLPGIPEDRLLEGSPIKLKHALRAALGADLVASAALVRAAAALHLPGHSSGLRGADQTLWERINKILLAEGNRPSTVAELALALKQQARPIKDLLVRAAQQQMTWRVSEERFALPSTVHAWAAHAAALAGPERTQRFRAAHFRDRAGVGRNLSIEILEFFDRVKFTRRLGDERLLQRPAHEVFGDPEQPPL